MNKYRAKLPVASGAEVENLANLPNTTLLFYGQI